MTFSTRILFYENKLLFSKYGLQILCNYSQCMHNNFSTNSRTNIDNSSYLQNKQPVADFYNGRSIFVTGATGFLGKVLVEKLLYETDLDKLFLLIRKKNNETIHKRVDEMLNNPIFDRLKDSRPSVLDKIVPIVGDIAVPDLGMKTEDANTLSEQVSVIFNLAASVLFNEPMKVSLNLNYEGTKQVMNLAHTMKRIESFVHVSSTYAYAFDGEPTIKESLYPPPENHDKLDEFVAKYNDDEIQTKKFIQRRANTYTYAKALADIFVEENHGKIPTCIVRPSIITPKKDPPLPGWLDNWFGTTRTYYNIVTGRNRVVFGHGQNLHDMIPVDYVANLCIIAATRNYSSHNVPVYNASSTGANPIPWKSISDCIIEEGVRHKLNILPYPFTIFTNSKLLLPVTSSLILIPLRIADSWLWITGRKPKYTKIQKKVTKFQNTLNFFTSNSWCIECDNVRSLYASLSESDQKRFPCDPVNIDWRKYLHDYLLGIERYLLKKPKK